jgi:hypothetical protein
VGTKRVLFIVAVISVWLFVTGESSCSSTSGNAGSAVSSSSPRASATPQQSVFQVGQAVKVGNSMIFTVTAVQSSAGTDFEKPQKGQFLVVNVSLQNISSKSQTVSSILSFELRDGSGQSYNETILSTAPKPPDGEIAPNDKLAGGLTFDVPKPQSFKLYFKNDVFGSGAVVVDLGSH